MSEEKIILSRDAYPANSVKGKQEAEEVKERPKREAITKGRRARKTIFQRIRGTFDEGELGNEILRYIVHDVVVPAAKAMIADLVEGGMEMALFGGERNPRVRRAGGRSYVSYGDMYGRGSVRDRPGRRDEGTSRRPVRHDFNGVILETRPEAEQVLTEMALILEEYDVVSVADLYELVGFDHDHTDLKYGWTDTVGMSTKRIREGWTLDLPRPRIID